MRNVLFLAILALVLFGTGLYAQEQSGFGNMNINGGDVEGVLTPLRIDEIRNGADIELLPEDGGSEPVRIRAQDIQFDWPEGASRPDSMLLDGNVIVNHPMGSITAAHAEWDVTSGDVLFTGSPKFNSDLLKNASGDRITINLNTGKISITNTSAQNIPIGRGESGGAGSQNQLQAADITDWQGLLAQIAQEAQSSGSTPGKHLMGLLDSQARNAFRVFASGDDLSTDQQGMALNQLNQLIRKRGFYNEEAWQGIATTEPTRELLGKGVQNLSQQEFILLNRRLLHEAYPDFVQAPE